MEPKYNGKISFELREFCRRCAACEMNSANFPKSKENVRINTKLKLREKIWQQYYVQQAANAWLNDILGERAQSKTKI